MAIVSTGAPAITDLAAAIESQLNASTGGGAKATIGDRSTAYDWTAGLPPWVGTLFNGVLVEGLTYRSTIVSPSATPAAKVAAGGQKPNGVTITASTDQLPKYAGYAEVTVEDIIDTDGLVTAIESVLLDQCLTAFCADIAAVMSGAALDATGDTWAAGILAAIGQLPAANVLVVSPSDLAVILSPSSGYQIGLADMVPMVFGLGLVPLPGLPAGTAYVAKSSALTLYDSKISPSVLVDPYSMSTTNVVRVIADMWAAAQLTAPGAVVAVAGPAAP